MLSHYYRDNIKCGSQKIINMDTKEKGPSVNDQAVADTICVSSCVQMIFLATNREDENAATEQTFRLVLVSLPERTWSRRVKRHDVYYRFSADM